MLALKREKAIRREASAAETIPITAHVDEHVARTKNGDYVQTFRLAGGSFQSADDEDLNTWHEKLNILWRNIASPNFALWSHVVRRRDNSYPAGTFAPGFAADLNEKYRRKVSGETLMVNEIFLSLVYRPQPSVVGSAALKVMKKTDKGQGAAELRDSLDECAKKRQELLAALGRYDAESLGIYKRGVTLFSSLLEFFAFLINGEWYPFPLPRAPLNEVLATTRPMFGNEAMEYRTPTNTRLAAFLGIKEYPTPTAPGMFSGLLNAPFPFVLTQTFTFLPKATAIDMMSRQHKRLMAAGDLAVSQADELKDALDDLVSNRFVLGDHHFTLQVQADPFDGVKEAEGSARLKQLNDNIARARFMLGETGMVVAREDLALEAAFWAQLPGNFAYRTRKAPITSRNFSAMSPFHNFPTGRATGNHWGDALTMFVTTALSPYFFSLHASDPNKPDGGSRKDVGHMAIFGPVGTGKTTVLGFCVAMLTKFGTTQVIFDKDEGLHILVRALGGSYLTLKNGQRTGCSPLRLPATPDNVEFMKQFLRVLVRRGDEPLTVRQEEDLDQALHGVLSLDPSARRLSRLSEFLDVTDPEGMYARLRKWCAKEGGDYAWVFDNPEDEIVGIMHGNPIIGFDVTDFLDNPTIIEPLTLYLLHLTTKLVDGRRLVVWMDEFAKMIGRPSMAGFAKNGLETWRKKNANFSAATQSTSHVINSPIARACIEQMPTRIYFPNPDADRKEYIEDFGLTEREFHLVKEELEPGSRTFLIKQGHASVVARLDLKGFDFELDVISGRTNNVELMKRLIAAHGSDPNVWLPKFKEARAAERAGVPLGNNSVSSKEVSHVAA